MKRIFLKINKIFNFIDLNVNIINKILFFILTISLVFLFNINNKNIEVGFSPGNSAQKIILQAIKESNQSIDVAAYSFTNKTIAIALIKAKKRNIKIRILTDKQLNKKKYSILSYLINQKIPVKINSNYNIMHNKFIIIDNVSIETGSFNYTENAIFRNAENVIYIRNYYSITKKYIQEFNRLWEEGKFLNL